MRFYSDPDHTSHSVSKSELNTGGPLHIYHSVHPGCVSVAVGTLLLSRTACAVPHRPSLSFAVFSLYLKGAFCPRISFDTGRRVLGPAETLGFADTSWQQSIVAALGFLATHSAAYKLWHPQDGRQGSRRRVVVPSGFLDTCSVMYKSWDRRVEPETVDRNIYCIDRNICCIDRNICCRDRYKYLLYR